MSESPISKELEEAETGEEETTASTAVGDSTTPTPDEGLVLNVDVASYVPQPLQPGWKMLQDYPLVLALLLVILGYLLGKLLQTFLNKVIGRLAEKTKADLDNQIVHYLAAPILQTTVTLSMVLAIFTLEIPDSVSHSIVRVLLSLLIFFWARAWFTATHDILAKMESHGERFTMFQPRTVPLFEMGIKLLLLGIFTYLFFVIWGIDATAWLASAGIIGIAVGFAAKDTLSNLISGVSIIADAPYKIGDYIVLDTGERGIVTSLGIRSTRLLTRDDVEISIPNAVIGAARITNESGGPWVKQRIRVPVGVAYGSDTEKVVRLLEEIALGNPGIVDQPAPRIRMRGFGDSSLNFEMLGWIGSPEQRGLVIHEILMDIDRRFRQEGIEIPFPQRDIHFPSGKMVEPTDNSPG